MSLSPRWALCGLVLFPVGFALASSFPAEDRPALHVPRKPITQQELDRREAQRLFGVAALHERNNRLVEAARTYEQAERLDPESAAIARALFPLYLAMDRTEDALNACRKVLRLDPDDYQTAYLYSRQLRGLGRDKEAAAALAKATRSKRLKERPDLAAQIWFDLGLLREKSGDGSGAEKCLREVVAILENPAALLDVGKYTREEINTQAAETWERLGRICLKNGNVDKAVEAFEKAKQKDSLRAPRLAFNLAQVYRDQKKYREAFLQLEVYLRNQPQGVEGYELRIELQKKLNRSADIVPYLEADSRRDPHNVALRLLLAREYRKAGRTKEAEQIYTSVLEYHVAPEVYRGLFAVLRERGGPGAAQILLLLDSALKVATGDEKVPGNPAQAKRARAMLIVLREDAALVRLLLPVAIRQLGRRRLDSTTRALLATLAARTKQLDEAERLYRSCLEQPIGRRDSEAEIYLGLLRVLRLQYKHAAIIEVCKRGLKEAQQTNRVLFHTELVRAYQMLNRHQDAVAAAETAVRDAGKREMLMCKRIWIDALSQAGSHEQALKECQALLKVYNQGGELRDVRATLSSVYQAMGKHDEAEKQLSMLLALDPNDATANNDLGYLWADRNKNLVEAERLIRKALELDRQQRSGGTSVGPESDRDNAAYVDSLGWVLFRLGKLDEACQELVRATRLPGGEDDPVVWDHLGDVYYRLEKLDLAEQAWNKALALYERGARRKSEPRMKEIQDKLRLIKP